MCKSRRNPKQQKQDFSSGEGLGTVGVRLEGRQSKIIENMSGKLQKHDCLDFSQLVFLKISEFFY